MNDVPREDLLVHLRRLIDDLQRFQPGEPLPWSVGRIFNELLQRVKVELGAHPLVTLMSTVKEHPDQEFNPGASTTTVGAVLAIGGQLLTALELAGGRGGAPASDAAFDLVEADAP